MVEVKSQVVYISVDVLKPNVYNPQTMDKKFEQLLKKNIETKGFSIPIVINKDKTIINGEHRWRIAKSLGMKEVPCIILDLPPAEERLACIAFNKFVGDTDLVSLAKLVTDIQKDGMDLDELQKRLGFSSVELDELKELSSFNTDGIRFPEVEDIPVEGAGQDGKKGLSEWTAFECLVPQEQMTVIRKELDRIANMCKFKSGDKSVRDGLALEKMAMLSSQEEVS